MDPESNVGENGIRQPCKQIFQQKYLPVAGEAAFYNNLFRIHRGSLNHGGPFVLPSHLQQTWVFLDAALLVIILSPVLYLFRV